MKDEKIIEYLKSFNFWGNDNVYMHVIAPEKFSNLESIYGIDSVLCFKYFIINKNENGIAVIPFDLTGKSISEAATFIPNENIDCIYMEKYKFMLFMGGIRVIIKTKDNKVLEFEYNKKKEENINKLVNRFPKISNDINTMEGVSFNNKPVFNVKVVLEDENLENISNMDIKIANNKLESEENFKYYKDVLIKLVQNINCQEVKFVFRANENTITDTIHLTIDALTSALFDISWYYHDNNIPVATIYIVVQSENTKVLYENACKKIGFI